jgi:hypothetical protein
MNGFVGLSLNQWLHFWITEMRKAKLLVDFSEVDGPAWSLGATVEVLGYIEGLLGTFYEVEGSDGIRGYVYPREIEMIEMD